MVSSPLVSSSVELVVEPRLDGADGLAEGAASELRGRVDVVRLVAVDDHAAEAAAVHLEPPFR
jgi:hypothetical protein